MPATATEGDAFQAAYAVANPAQGVDACDPLPGRPTRAVPAVANPAQGVDACDLPLGN